MIVLVCLVYVSCSTACNPFGDGNKCVSGAVCSMMTSINRENTVTESAKNDNNQASPNVKS